MRLIRGTSILAWPMVVFGASVGQVGSEEVPLQSCAELTDNVCRILWDPSHSGKMDYPGGSIRLGTTGRSSLSQVSRVHLEAVVDSVDRLPDDLRFRVRPILQELGAHLAREADNKAWFRDLDLNRQRFANAMEDTATERTERRRSDLRERSDRDKTVEDWAQYQADLFDLRNGLIRATWEGHPNWRRVESVFSQVRADLAATVRELPIPDDFKERLGRKIDSVQLTLPFEDPRLAGATPECWKDGLNAHYYSRHNKISVCAGYFNGYQSPEALYGMISHEMSHAVDPERMAYDDYEATPFARKMAEMSRAPGPAYPCGQWAELRRTAITRRASISSRANPFSPLTACLVDRSGLREFNVGSLRQAAERLARGSIQHHARYRNFTELALPAVTRDGAVVPNELYMRPDRLNARIDGYLFQDQDFPYASALQIFVQSLSCQRIEREGKTVGYADLPEGERVELFNRAVSETEEVLQAETEHIASFCGNECRFLVGDGISRPSKEHFADWLSYRTMDRAMSRIADIEQRRTFVAMAGSDLCGSPGPERDAPDLIEREKELSAEVHSEDRMRRLASFTTPVARHVRCTLTAETEKGVRSCDLPPISQ